MKYAKCLITVYSLALVGCASTVNIDFSDLGSVTTSGAAPVPVKVGDRFAVGDVLVESHTNVKLHVLPFQWSSMTHDLACPPGVNGWTPGGYVEIVADNLAGGSGPEIHFNNASIGIIAPGNQALSDLKFSYGDHGGNVNLIVNGTLYNDDNFNTIAPPGLSITVSPGLPLGKAQISGNIKPFPFTFPCPAAFPTNTYTAVVGGGQELWIDDLEFTP